jgi:hypothetical protein
MRIAANEDGALTAVRPYRNGAVTESPWGSHVKELLEQLSHPSMIPVPPTVRQVSILAALGYGTMTALAGLEINSEEFFRVALTAEIEPFTLRRFVGRALSKVRNEVLVSERYEDPYTAAGVKRIVHIDFEDVLVHNVKSGVYIFGVLIQGPKNDLTRAETALLRREIRDQERLAADPQRARHTPVLERDTTRFTDTEFHRKKFIVAESLTQAGVDDAWARFIRYLKSYDLLRGKDTIITTYSKHEKVKFEQEFEIVKDSPDAFTASQRRSAYYSEIEVPAPTAAEPDRVKKFGRLIGNSAFFRGRRDVTPADVFAVMDKMFDLLEPIRANLVFPTYTNSIKKVLDYAGDDTDFVRYPPGSNGLESMAWAFQYYETGEFAVIDRALTYNGMDIDGNRLMSDVIREHAGQNVERALTWSERSSARAVTTAAAVRAKRTITGLDEKERLLSTILGKPLTRLSSAKLTELMGILDRRDYLAERQEVGESADLEENDARARLQVMRFQMESERQSRLYDFFVRENRKLATTADAATLDALARLFMKPAQYLVPRHIAMISLLGQVRGNFDRLRLPRPRGATLDAQLTLPEALTDAMSEDSLDEYNLPPLPEREGSEDGAAGRAPVTVGDLRKVWTGLYFTSRFAAPAGAE